MGLKGLVALSTYTTTANLGNAEGGARATCSGVTSQSLAPFTSVMFQSFNPSLSMFSVRLTWQWCPGVISEPHSQHLAMLRQFLGCRSPADHLVAFRAQALTPIKRRSEMSCGSCHTESWAPNKQICDIL